jgi:hypothetical protein
MYEATAGTGLLVHLGALLQLLGLLNRNQLCLRLLVLLGSMAYVAYYYAYPDRPLWGAIFWSSVLGAANILGIGRILWERTSWRRSGDEGYLLNVFDTLSRGELRRLMRLGRRRVAARRTLIVEEGQPVASLYFVLDGQIEIVKAGRAFAIDPRVFIGEVAFLLNTRASASAYLQPGAKYIEWSAPDLRKALTRNPCLGQAMQELFNTQLAGKVANSWRMPSSQDDPQAAWPDDQGRERGSAPAFGPNRC